MEITVHNMISEESTTIHWHGLHQSHGTPFMDGVGLLTQCPIHPMASFKYSFKPDPAGTHGLHAHLGTYIYIIYLIGIVVSQNYSL